jgi:hypothetical protein
MKVINWTYLVQLIWLLLSLKLNFNFSVKSQSGPYLKIWHINSPCEKNTIFCPLLKKLRYISFSFSILFYYNRAEDRITYRLSKSFTTKSNLILQKICINDI